MVKLITLQFWLAWVVALISWLVTGLNIHALISALLGGLTYIVPTTASALVMNYFQAYPHWAGVAFLGATGIKIVMALLMFAIIFGFYAQSMLFLPYLLGLLAVSHLVFLLFLRVHRYGK